MAGKYNFPKKIVIDASTALAFLLPDERKTEVDKLFKAFADKKVALQAPEIFYFEVFNGLKSAVLRRRIKKQIAKKLLSNFLNLPIKINKIDFKKTFQISLKNNVSFYDAAYLSLAKQEKTPLYTLDKLLKK